VLTRATAGPRSARGPPIRLGDAFDKPWILALEVLEREACDVAPVDDPAVGDRGDRFAAVLVGVVDAVLEVLCEFWCA
jgi:hypothetical protein